MSDKELKSTFRSLQAYIGLNGPGPYADAVWAEMKRRGLK